MITKYDLQFLVNHYFVSTLTNPLHPVTADVCANFAYNCYSIIVGTPQGTNSRQQLISYLKANADYYGVDLGRAVQYFQNTPGFQQVFIQYIKDNYRIETPAEIIARKISDAAKYIGNLAASGIWGIIKPLIPIFGIGLLAVYLTNKVTNKKTAK